MTTKFNSNPRRQSTSGFNATRQLKLSPQCPHSNATPVSRSGSQEEKIERESWNCPGDHQSAIGGPYYQFDRLLSPANQLHKRTHWLKGRLLASREHWWPLVFPQNHMAALLTWWWELIWPSLPQVKISTTERQLVFSGKRETVLT